MAFGKAKSENRVDVISEKVVEKVPVLKFLEQWGLVVLYQGSLIIVDMENKAISSNYVDKSNKICSFDKLEIHETLTPKGTFCDLVIQECSGVFEGDPQSGTVYKARNVRIEN